MKIMLAHPCSQMHLQSETATVCTDADTYYPMGGTFINGIAHHFSLSSPVMTYTGENEALVKFDGVCYLKADKVCKCTVEMYINGSPAFSGAVDFLHANAMGNMSFPILIQVNNGDTFQVYIKSDTASTTFTVSQLVCVFT